MNIKELVYQRYPHKTGLSQISSHNLFITDILTKLVYHRYPQKMVYHKYPHKNGLSQISSIKEVVYQIYPQSICPQTMNRFITYILTQKWFITYILTKKRFKLPQAQLHLFCCPHLQILDNTINKTAFTRNWSIDL